MAIGFVLQYHEVLGLNGGTTSTGQDTTGANFIAAVVADYTEVTASQPVTDNKGNGSYTGLTAQINTGASGARARIHYKENAAVGSGHTWTNSGSILANVIYIFAFSGVATSSSFSNENGAIANTVSSLQTGSVAPTGTDVFIAGLGVDSTPPTVPTTINSSFNTALYDENNPGTTIGGAASYKLSSSSENPTFSMAGTCAQNAAVIASFKAAAGGGGTNSRLTRGGALTNGGNLIGGRLAA